MWLNWLGAKTSSWTYRFASAWSARPFQIWKYGPSCPSEEVSGLTRSFIPCRRPWVIHVHLTQRSLELRGILGPCGSRKNPPREMKREEKMAKWSERGEIQRDELPFRSKMSSGRNSAELDDVALSRLTPLKPAPHGCGARPGRAQILSAVAAAADTGPSQAQPPSWLFRIEPAEQQRQLVRRDERCGEIQNREDVDKNRGKGPNVWLRDDLPVFDLTEGAANVWGKLWRRWFVRGCDEWNFTVHVPARISYLWLQPPQTLVSLTPDALGRRIWSQGLCASIHTHTDTHVCSCTCVCIKPM